MTNINADDIKDPFAKMDFLLRKSYESRNNKSKTLDWERAIRIIAAREPDGAIAGIREDFHATAGCIYQNGEPIKEHAAWTTSNWGTPCLLLVFEEEEEEEEFVFCWKMENEDAKEDKGWTSKNIYLLNSLFEKKDF